jgi:DNA processing protein
MLYNPHTAQLVIAVIAQRLRNFSTGDYLILGSHADANEFFTQLAAGKAVTVPDQLLLHLPNPLKFQEEDISLAKHDLMLAWHHQIAAISICCPDYPPLLRHINDPPLLLWGRGNLQQLGSCSHAISIVGSRRAQSPAISCARELAAEASAAQIPVVSGLATGIDYAAHTGALRHHHALPTIAVLGGGIERLYPAQHAPLAAQIIAQQGVILSEYPPFQNSQAHQFIARNRIIAGLSQATVVVQAAQRSGALATARFAIENNRELLVAPGNARDPAFAGSHNLLKQGAALVTSFADVKHLYPQLPALPDDISPPILGPTTAQETAVPLRESILRIVATERGTSLEVLQDALIQRHPAVDLSEISTALDALEMTGSITIDPTGEVSLTHP